MSVHKEIQQKFSQGRSVEIQRIMEGMIIELGGVVILKNGTILGKIPWYYQELIMEIINSWYY